MAEIENIRDEAWERSLDFIERGDEMTDEELDRLLNDEEASLAINELLEYKQAVMEENAHALPDIDKELARFHEEHPQPNGQTAPLFRIGWRALAVAASITVLFILSWQYFRPGQAMPDAAPSSTEVAVLEVDDGNTHPILKTDGGTDIILDDTDASHALEEMGVRSQASADIKTLLYGTSHVNVHQQTLIIPRGQSYKVILADNTEVWLNAGSEIEYPTSFAGRPERTIRLQGEAYFKVAKDADHPFVVIANGIQTRVLGTEFNIRSYDPEKVQVTLVSGSIEVSSGSESATSQVLSPGQQAMFNVQNSTFHIQDVDTEIYTSWHDGYFYYDDTPLQDVMQEIGRWYNQRVVFTNPDKLNHKIHFVGDKSDGIEKTLKMLNSINVATITRKENTLFVN